jgi:hypothetical protein
LQAAEHLKFSVAVVRSNILL